MKDKEIKEKELKEINISNKDIKLWIKDKTRNSNINNFDLIKELLSEEREDNNYLIESNLCTLVQEEKLKSRNSLATEWLNYVNDLEKESEESEEVLVNLSEIQRVELEKMLKKFGLDFKYWKGRILMEKVQEKVNVLLVKIASSKEKKQKEEFAKEIVKLFSDERERSEN